MTAAAEDRDDKRKEGKIEEYPQKTAVTAYKGTFQCIDPATGYLVPGANTAGYRLAGIAVGGNAAGSAASGFYGVDIWEGGKFSFITSGMAITDVGKPVFMADDQTVALITTNYVYAGKIYKYISATEVLVKIDDAVNGYLNEYKLAIPINLVDVTDGDVVTTLTPGHNGLIKKLEFVVGTPVTTASKLTTLNAEIGATNVTGGAVALTSANCTPLGAVIAGSAVTAANAFIYSDTISIEAASTTQFAEGSGVLLITILQY